MMGEVRVASSEKMAPGRGDCSGMMGEERVVSSEEINMQCVTVILITAPLTLTCLSKGREDVF